MVVLAGSQLLTKDSTSLKEAFKDKYLIGVAINRGQIHSQNSAEDKLIKSQFNSITAENDMKWMHIHPAKDRFNWEHADKFVELGEANNMFIIGHTLVWHSQLAPWVFKSDDGGIIDSVELMYRMKDHIYSIVGRYKDKINGWDVVNEALEENGSLRKSQCMQMMQIQMLNYITMIITWSMPLKGMALLELLKTFKVKELKLMVWESRRIGDWVILL
jgi:endo-1,4-beta-xylanase